MSRSGGTYSRNEVDLLNTRRDGPAVDASEITRVYRGDLSSVLARFAPKPMPDDRVAPASTSAAPSAIN